MQSARAPLFLAVALAFLFGGAVRAKDKTEDPASDLAMAELTATIGIACGAEPAEAHAAARVIAARLKEQQPEFARNIAAVDIDSRIFDNVDGLREEIKASDGMAMERPCSSWRVWLDRMIAYDGDFLSFGKLDTNEPPHDRSAKSWPYLANPGLMAKYVSDEYKDKAFDLVVGDPDVEALFPQPGLPLEGVPFGPLTSLLREGGNKADAAKEAEALKSKYGSAYTYAALRDYALLLSAAGRYSEARNRLATALKAPDAPLSAQQEIDLLTALVDIRNGKPLAASPDPAACAAQKPVELTRACLYVVTLAATTSEKRLTALRALRAGGSAPSFPFDPIGADPHWNGLRVGLFDALRNRYPQMLDTRSQRMMARGVTEQYLQMFLNPLRNDGATSIKALLALTNLVYVDLAHHNADRARFWLDLYKAQVLDRYADGIEDLTPIAGLIAVKYAIVTHYGADRPLAAKALKEAEDVIAPVPDEVQRYARFFLLADALDEPAFPGDANREFLAVWDWAAKQPDTTSDKPLPKGVTPPPQGNSFSLGDPEPLEDEQAKPLQFAAGVRLVTSFAQLGDLRRMEVYRSATSKLTVALDRTCNAPLHAALLDIATADAIRRFSPTPERLAEAARLAEEALDTAKTRLSNARGEPRALTECWRRIGRKIERDQHLYNESMLVSKRVRERAIIALGRIYALQGRKPEAKGALEDGFSLFIDEYGVGGRTEEQSALAADLAQLEASSAPPKVGRKNSWLDESNSSLQAVDADSIEMGRSLALRGSELAHQDDYLGAELALGRAIAVERRFAQKPNRRLIGYQNQLARVYLNEQDADAAASLYANSLDALELGGGDALVAEEREAFGDYIVALFGQTASGAERATMPATIEKSFLAVQRHLVSQAGAALELANRRMALGNPHLERALQTREELRRQRSALDGRFAEAFATTASSDNTAAYERINSEVAQVEAQIRAQTDELQLARWSSETGAPLSVQEVRYRLRDDQALVVADSAGDRVFVWLLTKSQPPLWFQATLDANQVNDLVQTLRCGLDDSEWADPQTRCASRVGRQRLQGEPLPFRLDAAFNLYQGLFGQIDGALAQKQILFVSNGALAALPLQVLVTAPQVHALASSDAEYKTVPWLAVRNAVWVIPSVSNLRMSVRSSSPASHTPSLLAYGNPLLIGAPRDKGAAQKAWSAQGCGGSASAPTGNGIDDLTAANARLQAARKSASGEGLVALEMMAALPPLPETRDQLCQIAQDPRRISAVFLGARATKASLVEADARGDLAKADIVVFATHALLPGGSGSTKSLAEPALVLTPPLMTGVSAVQSDIGLLTASEIAKLEFRADWVILSACDTAGAERRGGEPLSGLARAFMYAGARAVLVSQWPVTTQSAASVTANLIENAETDKAAALQVVERLLIQGEGNDEALRHPSAWAPFMLVGSGGARNP